MVNSTTEWAGDFSGVGELTYAFVFVCHHGQIELESLLLAKTLRRFLECKHEIVVVIPGPSDILGRPEKDSLDIFEELNINVQWIENPFLEDYAPVPPYLLANKFCCFEVDTRADVIVYVDSDTLFFRKFSHHPRFSLQLTAKNGGPNGSFPFDGLWKKLYEVCEMEMPRQRWLTETGSNEARRLHYRPLYFNTSFVSVRKELAKELVRVWREYFLIVEKSGLIKKGSRAHYHLGQATFPMAVQKIGITYEVIADKSLEKFSSHYMRPKRILANGSLLKIAKDIARRDPRVKRLSKQYYGWEFLHEGAIMTATRKMVRRMGRS